MTNGPYWRFVYDDKLSANALSVITKVSGIDMLSHLLQERSIVNTFLDDNGTMGYTNKYNSTLSSLSHSIRQWCHRWFIFTFF